MADPLAGPSTIPGGDLAEVAARFGAELRRAGWAVGRGGCEGCASAVPVARPRTPDSPTLCALATLVSGKDQIEILRAVFSRVFGGLADPAARPGDLNPPAPGLPSTPDDLLAKAAQAARAHASEARPAGTPEADGTARDDPSEPEPEREIEHRYLGSTVERLAAQDFAQQSESELLLLAGLMRRITLAVPVRRSRRQHRRPGGPRTDMRSTLRQPRRTAGDAVLALPRGPPPRPPRLVGRPGASRYVGALGHARLQLC